MDNKQLHILISNLVYLYSKCNKYEYHKIYDTHDTKVDKVIAMYEFTL